MKEKIKSAVLLFLVCSSLALTFYLWFGLPSYGESGEARYRHLFLGQPRPLENIVAPQRIVLSAPEDDRQYILGRGDYHFNAVWAEVRLMLRDNFDASALEIITEAPASDGDLLISFDPFYPLSGNSVLTASFDLQELQLSLAENQVTYLDQEGRLFRQDVEVSPRLHAMLQNPEQRDALTEYRLLGGEQVAGDEAAAVYIEGQLYVPVSELQLPALTLMREDLELDRLLELMFLERGLVRRIEERDGSVIYTDGEKGLRVLVTGMFELTAPRVERGKLTLSAAAGLRKASEYLSFYGGWPPGLELVAFEKQATFDPWGQREYYYAHWKPFVEGLPLIGDSIQVIMSFNDQGLFKYERRLLTISHKNAAEPVISYDTVLATAARLLQDSDYNPVIKDLFLAYYIDSPVRGTIYVPPAWVAVVKDGPTLVINAHTAELIEVLAEGVRP